MDTTANFLTSLRNAEMAGHKTVTVPLTKMNTHIAQIFQDKGVISSFKEVEATCVISLVSDKRHTFKRVSKPGRRLYVAADEIPSVLGGRGFVVISTSAGVLSGQEARKRKVGGEFICEVY